MAQIDAWAVHELQMHLKRLAAEWLAFSERIARDRLAIQIGEPMMLAHRNTHEAIEELVRVYGASDGKPRTMAWVASHARILDEWECLWGSPGDPELWDDYAEQCLESLCSDDCRQALADWSGRLEAEDIADVLAEWPADEHETGNASAQQKPDKTPALSPQQLQSRNQAVREAVRSQGRSPAEVARAFSISTSQVSRILNGKTKT